MHLAENVDFSMAMENIVHAYMLVSQSIIKSQQCYPIMQPNKVTMVTSIQENTCDLVQIQPNMQANGSAESNKLPIAKSQVQR